MATWQFDFLLVPRAAVERRYGTVPLTISEEDYESVDWWAHDDHRIGDELSRLLPKGRAWHPEIETWGAEDGNRFDVIHEHQRMAELFGRIDVRELSLLFVNQVVSTARRNDWLIITASRHVLRASVKELMSAIHRSPSFAFVKDPQAFLNRLSESEE